MAKSLGAWSTITVASIEKARGYFCEEHQRYLAKACPGIRFQPLVRTVQVLAQYRRTEAVKAEETAAAEALRQRQIEAEQAKVEVMAGFAANLFDATAIKPNGHEPSRCRMPVLSGSQGATLRRRASGNGRPAAVAK